MTISGLIFFGMISFSAFDSFRSASILILIAHESIDLKSESIVTGIFYGIAPQPESRLIDIVSSFTTGLAPRQDQ